MTSNQSLHSRTYRTKQRQRLAESLQANEVLQHENQLLTEQVAKLRIERDILLHVIALSVPRPSPQPQ